MGNQDKRKFDRVPVGTDVFFQLSVDVKTQVNFQIIDRELNRPLSRKYLALSKNVSIEGVCFSSLKKLEEGELLVVEIVSPASKQPVQMKGQVRWSRKLTPPEFDDNKFDTGVKILEINGRPIDATYTRDAEKKVVWSGVLEAVMGSFKA